MGEVFHATDTRLGRTVAIKACREQFSERFHHEARAISSLNHPNICTLYDVGPNYLVMEFIQGETLAQLLKKGPLKVELALEYGVQIAEALVEAHSKGVTHRDLKPGNIMLARVGGKTLVKVLDFGLAKAAGDSMIESGVIMGTPAYMAPEQLQGKGADGRSDIFSFGMVLSEMITGKRVAPGQKLQLDSLPEKFCHVVERCLEPNPEDRWQTARDVKAELEWAAKPSGAESPAQAKSLPHKLLWIATVAVLATALAMVYFRQPYDGRIVRSTILPPEKTSFSFSTNLGPMALSPDGRRMVFAATAEDRKTQLWIRPLDAGGAQPLGGTEGGQGPFLGSRQPLAGVLR